MENSGKHRRQTQQSHPHIPMYIVPFIYHCALIWAILIFHLNYCNELLTAFLLVCLYPYYLLPTVVQGIFLKWTPTCLGSVTQTPVQPLKFSHRLRCLGAVEDTCGRSHAATCLPRRWGFSLTSLPKDCRVCACADVTGRGFGRGTLWAVRCMTRAPPRWDFGPGFLKFLEAERWER